MNKINGYSIKKCSDIAHCTYYESDDNPKRYFFTPQQVDEIMDTEILEINQFDNEYEKSKIQIQSYNKEDIDTIPIIINKKLGYVLYDHNSPIVSNIALHFKREHIIFSVIAVYDMPDFRKTIKVLSHDYSNKKNKPNVYYFYESISDGRFLRFCVSNGSSYIKGVHYASTTMINLELQKFLWDNMNGSAFYGITSDYKERSEICPKDVEIFDNHPKLDKRMKIPNNLCAIFDVLQFLFNDVSCNAVEEEPETRLFIPKNVPKFVQSRKNIKNIMTSSERPNSFNNDACGALYDILKKYKNIDWIIDYVTNIFDYYKLGDVNIENITESYYINIINAIGSIFTEFFQPCSRSQLLTQRKIQLLDTKVNMNIFKTLYISKYAEQNGDRHIICLYHAEYTAQKNIHSHIQAKTLKVCIYMKHLLVLDKTQQFKFVGEINEYGMDEFYITPGILSYKMFDYVVQQPVYSKYVDTRDNHQNHVVITDRLDLLGSNHYYVQLGFMNAHWLGVY